MKTLLCLLLLAQNANTDFIEDRKGDKQRMFYKGQWLTVHYRPGTDQQIRIEAPDTVEEFEWADGNTRPTGVTVRVNGLRLSAGSNQSGRVSMPGMPDATIERDPKTQRDVRVLLPAQVAELSYAADETLRAISIGRVTLELTPSGKDEMTQTLRSGDRILRETKARAKVYRGFHTQSFCLDPAIAAFGLQPDWENSFRFRTSLSGSLLTVTNTHGEVVLYLVQHDRHRFGFSPKGEALFYDLSLDLRGDPHFVPGSHLGKGKHCRACRRRSRPPRITFHCGGAPPARASRGQTRERMQSFWTKANNGLR